jgi:hypothetical protein
MEEQIVSDKFKLWKKWFWIGMVIGFFDLLTGLIFGIALISEKEHRREGMIIILFTLTCFVLKNFVIFPWLMNAGYLPQYQLTKV